MSNQEKCVFSRDHRYFTVVSPFSSIMINFCLNPGGHHDQTYDIITSPFFKYMSFGLDTENLNTDDKFLNNSIAALDTEITIAIVDSYENSNIGIDKLML